MHLEKANVKHSYSMDNIHTTRDEKVEIEAWYQLPVDMSGIVFDLSCLFWVRGNITGWHVYAISSAAGILTAIAVWFVYVKKMVFALEMLLNFPVVRWLIHLVFAAWLCLTGAWIQAIFVACNCLLLLMPVGIGAMLTNQMLTSKYEMHPKYAFLKHIYGKIYSFESD